MNLKPVISGLSFFVILLHQYVTNVMNKRKRHHGFSGEIYNI